MEQKSKRSSMTKSEIVSIIQKVLSMTESVVAQLKAEKKTKGDYSKSLTVQDGDLQMRFDAMEYCGKYPQYPSTCYSSSLSFAMMCH